VKERVKRSYESSLRAEQAELTRQRILDAVTELLADPVAEELTIPLVALRAQVSLRTVYRHFPAREALFDAWGEWAEKRLQIPIHSYPPSADGLAAFALTLYRSYDEHEPLLRALLGAKAARGLRARTRRRRQRSFEAAMGQLTDGLSPEARARALAAVYLLISAPAWHAMREQWNLDGVQAGHAAAWAVGVLLDELRRNPKSVETAVSSPGDR
jgi:AcrR family transcriptional regulator